MESFLMLAGYTVAEKIIELGVLIGIFGALLGILLYVWGLVFRNDEKIQLGIRIMALVLIFIIFFTLYVVAYVTFYRL